MVAAAPSPGARRHISFEMVLRISEQLLGDQNPAQMLAHGIFDGQADAAVKMNGLAGDEPSRLHYLDLAGGNRARPPGGVVGAGGKRAIDHRARVVRLDEKIGNAMLERLEA